MINGKSGVAFDAKQIDAIFAELDQCHLPGAVVGIAIDGVPVYRKGFGLATMELPVVLSPSMRMRIASTTKQFTCFAYMLLCEEGKSGIDDPIGKYLPELHPSARRVTMRQLMTNTSGLRDVRDIEWRFSGMERDVPSEEVLSLYRTLDDVHFAPGTGWRYNNGGFALLSAAIERIAGQSLEEVYRTRIFEPIGMFDTALRRVDSNFLPNSATLHMTTAAGGYDRTRATGESSGDGGIVSTADDMLRWLAHIDAPRVGSAALWKVMRTPQLLVNGTSTGYGLGLFISSYRGVETLWHAGALWGGSCQMLKAPALGLDIVVIANRHDATSVLLANKILDTCIPGLDPVKEAPERPAATGTFRSAATGRIIHLSSSSLLAYNKGARQIVAIDGTEMAFEPPDEAGVLRPAELASSMHWIVSLIGDPRQPTAVRFNDFGNVDELEAVKPATRDAAESIAGRYRSDATQTEATIRVAAAGPQLHTAGRFGSMVYDLKCLADGVWQAEFTKVRSFRAVVAFDGDNGTFRFSTYATSALPFRRCPAA